MRRGEGAKILARLLAPPRASQLSRSRARVRPRKRLRPFSTAKLTGSGAEALLAAAGRRIHNSSSVRATPQAFEDAPIDRDSFAGSDIRDRINSVLRTYEDDSVLRGPSTPGRFMVAPEERAMGGGLPATRQGVDLSDFLSQGAPERHSTSEGMRELEDWLDARETPSWERPPLPDGELGTLSRSLANQEHSAFESVDSERRLELQLRLEQDYRELKAQQRQLRELIELRRASSSDAIQERALVWYEAASAAMDGLQSRLRCGKTSRDRDLSPILALEPDVLATITVNETLNACFAALAAPADKAGGSGSGGGADGAAGRGNASSTARKATSVRQLSLSVSNALMVELASARLAERIGRRAAAERLGHSVKPVVRRINLAREMEYHADMKEELKWSLAKQTKIGATLLREVLDSARLPSGRRGRRGGAFSLGREYQGDNRVEWEEDLDAFLLQEVGVDRQLLRKWGLGACLEQPPASAAAGGRTKPKLMPMVVPPVPWHRKSGSLGTPHGPWRGGYLRSRVDLVRLAPAASESHRSSVAAADMPRVIEGLNILSHTPWRINEYVHRVAREARDRNITVADLPCGENASLGASEAALAALPRGSDRYMDEDAVRARQKKRKVDMHNANLHSLRCTLALKLGVAEEMSSAECDFYFPHNLDFRGRAYPVPPHLNYMGDDLSRGLLQFSRGKPLGADGLKWLKVHFANLSGADKLSHAERVAFAEERLDAMRRAVADPLREGENRELWASADEPWQCLAVARELVLAHDHPLGPEAHVCHVPVHQDGSCNGLQHYAALGRDAEGGRAVNLVGAERPQDVYMDVCREVQRSVDAIIDAGEPPEGASDEEREAYRLAKLVRPHVERKVVKQTVMTSVYGVTFIGARDQIQNRLAERIYADQEILSDEQEQDIRLAAKFLAQLTLGGLGKLFRSAKEIMEWLADASSLVAKARDHPMSWVTPLGLPVVQPYRQDNKFRVRTAVARVTLVENSDAVPVMSQKQRSAFPPNYVHSLDSTHMLLTCIEMQRRGLVFAAVHDSYWTHACDVPQMNEILRDKFCELYNTPVLEDLERSLRLRYPDVDFPPLPARGDLDLEVVKAAPYFFS